MSPLIETALKAHNAGYDVVACHGKAPIYLRWQDGTRSLEEIRQWEADQRITNIGIRTGGVVGVDIDISDAALSERIKNLATIMLGDTRLVRIGRAPRQLLVYRVAQPFAKKIAIGANGPDGKPHKVEVLAKGQQFVAYGIHPDTMQPYVWPESDLISVPLSGVTVTTEADIEAFIIAVQGAIGSQPKAPPKPASAPPGGFKANGVDHGPADKDDVLEALYAIPGDLEYDEWIRVGMALYSALGPGAGNHWAAWSARSAKNVPETTAKRWPSFSQVRDIHAETLFYVARHHGWKPERERQDDDISKLGIFGGQRFSDTPDADGVFQPIGEGVGIGNPDADKTQQNPQARAVVFTLYTRIDPRKIPPRRFLYGRHYIRQFLSTDIAPGGLGKSSLAIVDAVAMAAHRDLVGTLPTERLRVAYWNGEDPLEELQRRVEAVCLHYGIKPEEMDGRLFVDSGRLLPLILAREGRNGVVLDQQVIDAIIESIRASGIDVLIIDPFIATHRVGENDNNAIELVAKAWSHIADVTGCSINLVHHSRKLNGEEVTVESGRGASALLAACRSARTLNPMTKDEAAQLGVEMHRLYFRVDDGKSNLTPPAEGAVWYRLVNVDLPNGPMGTTGDKVGVVTKWEKPDPMATLTSRDLLKVQNVVSTKKWRANAQAGDWVGKAVAQALNMSLPEDAVRIRYLVAVWINSGALTIVQGLDAHREKKDFVEVGNWVEPDE